MIECRYCELQSRKADGIKIEHVNVPFVWLPQGGTDQARDRDRVDDRPPGARK
jgi:hypothetical protein